LEGACKKIRCKIILKKIGEANNPHLGKTPKGGPKIFPIRILEWVHPGMGYLGGLKGGGHFNGGFKKRFGETRESF